MPLAVCEHPGGNVIKVIWSLTPWGALSKFWSNNGKAMI